MNEWLLSIVGIICLGLLLEIVMPEGQMTKYVRGAFSLLVIFVVASPLPTLISGETSLTSVEVDFEIDDEYLAQTTADYADAEESDIEDFLLLYGYDSDAKVFLSDDFPASIEKIELKIFLSVLDAENANTHIEKVVELVSARTGTEADKIFVTAEVRDYGSD